MSLPDTLRVPLRVARRGEVTVSPANRAAIPATDAHAVRIGQVNATVAQPDAWKRIVHNGGTIVGAAGEVVLKPQRVTHLVRAELADAGQRHLGQPRIGVRVGERRQQALGQQVILANAQRAERDVTL